MSNIVGSKNPKAKKRRANKFELDSVLLQLKAVSQILLLDMDEDTALEMSNTLENCSKQLLKISTWFKKRGSFVKEEAKKIREVIDIRTMSDDIEDAFDSAVALKRQLEQDEKILYSSLADEKIENG